MSHQPRSLLNKVVVITGGARGIGAATAKAFVDAGAIVVIGDLDASAAAETARSLGGAATGLGVDVTDRKTFTAFLDEVISLRGQVDVLVNNAGIMQLAGFEEQDDATIDRQIEINLRAVIHGTRAASRLMGQRGGHIVNVASVAGKFGFPGAATYCATKHGVVGFSEAVRLELRGGGIEISCVMPGVARTELAAGLGEAALFKSVTPEQVADAIIDAIRFPRFDVFVPRNLAAMYRLMRVLPRGPAEWLVRRLRGDRILADAVGSTQRAQYESRAAASAPAMELEQQGEEG